jgi:hypothetical protein
MEKCKTKLVPKLVDHQNKYTKKLIDKMYKRRIEQEVGQGNKAKLKTDLEKIKKNKPTTKDKERLVKTLTNAYCNPGCKGTLFQEDGFDAETFVKENNLKISAKLSPKTGNAY